jgi:hypothetical protein
MIDASTTQTIETGLKNIAATAKLGTSCQDALQWFTGKNQEWLLFFDNADNPKINLRVYLPKCNHGNILITSRNPELRVHAGSHSQVSDMEKEDAVDLLLKSALEDNTPENWGTAAEIVKVSISS